MKRVSMVASYTAATAQPTHRRVMESDDVARADLLVWGPLMDVTTLSWFDAEPTAVERLLAGVEAVSEVYLVPDGDGTYAFVDREGYEFADAVLDLIADSQVVFVPPLTFRETGEITFEAVGERAQLSAFHEALTGLVDVRIERVDTFHHHGSAATLTDRQRRALSAAREAGYYEVPRTGSVADVAEALDCATSTANELLRKAEAAVVEGFLAGGPDPRT